MKPPSRFEKWLLLGAFVSLTAVAYFIAQNKLNDPTAATSREMRDDKIMSRSADVPRSSEPTDADFKTADFKTIGGGEDGTPQMKSKGSASVLAKKAHEPLPRRALARAPAQEADAPDSVVQAEPPAHVSILNDRRSAPSELPMTSNERATDKDSLVANEFWLWLGVGENYQYYQQTIPSLEGNTKFQNIAGPTLLLKGGVQGEKWGLDVFFKDTPGQMESSDSVQVQDGNYHWLTLSSEALYRPQGSSTNWRFGIQHHLMPFMYLNAADTLIEVKKNSVMLATAGFERVIPLSQKARFEWMMRYQYPLLSGTSDGGVFKVSPQFAFDGSLGGVYSVTANSRVGLYWYGQWHQYKFTYAPIGVEGLTGSQTLFYSNIELRLGLEF